jgi:hypothetical protein
LRLFEAGGQQRAVRPAERGVVAAHGHLLSIVPFVTKTERQRGPCEQVPMQVIE